VNDLCHVQFIKKAGAERNYIPNNDWNGHTIGTSNAPYNGEWIFLRGLDGPYSTGWSGNSGFYHTKNGVRVPLDSSYHIPADRQYWDRLSGQSTGWVAEFPIRRWMLTKLTLLIAEKAGWKLNRKLTPFLEPEIVTTSLPNAVKGQRYSQKLTTKGGVPFCDWTLKSGSLPVGLTLDRFTGTISGTVSANQTQNSYTFTIELRDYDEFAKPFTRSFTIQL
jgi:hypothetical protein